jgi:hypothetical protein
VVAPPPAPKPEPKPEPKPVAAAPAPAPPPPPPAPEPKPAAAAKGGTPMEIATACLGQGDNKCVIEALDGKAKTAREYELLIETLRATGRSKDAQKYMATYVEKFPDERRANSYRRTLELQGAAPAPAP